jgi:hypothetical protein
MLWLEVSQSGGLQSSGVSCDLQLRFGSLNWQAFERMHGLYVWGIANEIIK